MILHKIIQNGMLKEISDNQISVYYILLKDFSETWTKLVEKKKKQKPQHN